MTLRIKFLRFFFFLIYHPLAFLYDWVAYAVSFGQWNRWVVETQRLLGADPILELGHGPGHLQFALHRAGRQVFGLDFSSQMIRLAHRRLARAGCRPRLVRGRAEKLPFRQGTFSSVVATFPSEYIYSVETLAEIRRVLAEDGILVVLLGAQITGRNLVQRLTGWLYRVTGQGVPSPTMLEGAQQRIEEAGLKGMFEYRQCGAASLLLFIARPVSEDS